MSCPLCYKLQYIDGLKPKERWYFSFGTTMHSCTERFFRVSTPHPPPLEEMLRYYEDSWLSDGYESPEEEARYREYGSEILTRFWQIHSADFRMPVAIERAFNIDVGGVTLRGFIDRVDMLESGGLSIVDYKTNKDLFTADYIDDDLQLTLYQIAASRLWRMPVEKLTLYHLRSNTACSCPPRDEARLEQARRLVLEVADNIARGNFPATENQFCPCDFPEYCPYHRHEYMVGSPAPSRQEMLPGMAAVEAVERYASLQQQIKALQEQLDETKRELVNFCQCEGLNRVFGSEHEITYKLIEKTGYNEDDVRAILEPLGLWQRVVCFDQSSLKRLLADRDIPDSVIDNLKSIKQIVSTYPQLWLRKRNGEEI